jgi:hypothetical protein
MFRQNQNKANVKNPTGKSETVSKDSYSFKSKSQINDFISETKHKTIKLISASLEPEFIEAQLLRIERQMGAKNPAFASDHIKAVFEFFKTTEDKFQIDKDIMEAYLEMYRNKICPWLLLVYETFDISLRSVLTTMYLFFRHVSTNTIFPGNLKKFVIGGYLLIATKYHEIDPPEADDLLRLLYSKKIIRFRNESFLAAIKPRMIEAERAILLEVGFRIVTPYLFDYIEILICLEVEKEVVYRLIKSSFLANYIKNPQFLFDKHKGMRSCAIDLLNAACTTKRKMNE